MVFERADGVVCSQVFSTIESAEKRVQRTHARGLNATLQLVRLVPVGVEIDDSTVPSSILDLFEAVSD